MGNNPSHFSGCGEDCPVENVSWNDVNDFIEKLNQKTGRRYRLPTGVEWETACRAGSSFSFCGSDQADGVAWFRVNANQRTHISGQKAGNAWGLYDMSGNVMEWTADCFSGSCVSRGGAWYNKVEYVRSGNTDTHDKSYRDSAQGFRLVLDR